MKKAVLIPNCLVIVLSPLLLLLLMGFINTSMRGAIESADADSFSIVYLNYALGIIQYVVLGVLAYYICTLRFQKAFLVPFIVAVVYLVLIAALYPVVPFVWRTFTATGLPALLAAVYFLKLIFSLRRRPSGA